MKRIIDKAIGTNRKLSEIFTAINSKKFLLRPSFQRNLVWAKKHKNAIVHTVLDGYPFPEIYIATGKLDLETADRTELLVDGQQRISSLYQYFIDSEEFEYEREMKKFATLSDDEKRNFLSYTVVVRDLGDITEDEIIQVFERINSTSYNLKKIEINNARYDGEFINYCEELSYNTFFDNIFTKNDVKRMSDISFCATVIATILGGYFDGDKHQEVYFQKYNDEFTEKKSVNDKLEKVFSFIKSMNLTTKRWQQKADIFTLIIELYNTISEHELDADILSKRLDTFYNAVDNAPNATNQTSVYHKSALQGTNQRSNRINRAQIIREIITSSI
ncbi:MAG: DUF262 domain-containing protein [Firmicutes bacterium]|nr:DUF262 domain-containing protein [Bacillota bacterium]